MQRGQVFSLMVLEGLVLGGVGAVVGAAAAVILLKATVGQGFEVSEETLQVFFGGPRLIPRMEAGTILAVVASVIGEVVLASLWPAWSGSSVSPRVAMSRGND
jgi:ABC-type lipoprotein release transport system permease subunit